jgi:D-sedoheptulose 7-phosphate isomerase
MTARTTGEMTAELHCRALEEAVGALRTGQLPLLTAWGETLAAVLAAGGRLLAAGNGGSAAQAGHLTAELVGRYRAERPAFSAIALHAEAPTVTAVANDYGYEELFARQVAAHGRPGDVLLLLSTSGRSPNLVRAAHAARSAGLTTWALTGPRPNPLSDVAGETLCVEAAAAATVQEVHLVAVHLLCEAFDAALGGGGPRPPSPPARVRGAPPPEPPGRAPAAPDGAGCGAPPQSRPGGAPGDRRARPRAPQAPEAPQAPDGLERSAR